MKLPKRQKTTKVTPHHRFVIGPALTLADLSVAAALYSALTVDLARWPRTQTWRKTC